MRSLGFKPPVRVQATSTTCCIQSPSHQVLNFNPLVKESLSIAERGEVVRSRVPLSAPSTSLIEALVYSLLFSIDPWSKSHWVSAKHMNLVLLLRKLHRLFAQSLGSGGIRTQPGSMEYRIAELVSRESSTTISKLLSVSWFYLCAKHDASHVRLILKESPEPDSASSNRGCTIFL